MLRFGTLLLSGALLALLSAFYVTGGSEPEISRIAPDLGRSVQAASAERLTTQQPAQQAPKESFLSVRAVSDSGAVARIRFNTAAFSPVHLFIADTSGVQVRTLVREHLAAGSYEITWFGETDLASPLAPGTYIVTLHTREERRLSKVNLPEPVRGPRSALLQGR